MQDALPTEAESRDFVQLLRAVNTRPRRRVNSVRGESCEQFRARMAPLNTSLGDFYKVCDFCDAPVPWNETLTCARCALGYDVCRACHGADTRTHAECHRHTPSLCSGVALIVHSRWPTVKDYVAHGRFMARMARRDADLRRSQFFK